MTNAEKYLKDGTDVRKLAEEFIAFARQQEDRNVEECMYKFFKTNATHTLTEDERVILRNIKNVRSIKRDNEGDLVIYKIDTGIYYITEYNHLFQFIKERRRILY